MPESTVKVTLLTDVLRLKREELELAKVQDIDIFLLPDKAKFIIKKPKPCDFKPVQTSDKRYRLNKRDCYNPTLAKSVYGQGKADIGVKKRLSADQLNNLACAAMWTKPPCWEKAKKWFKEAYNKVTDQSLSDTSSQTIRENVSAQ